MNPRTQILIIATLLVVFIGGFALYAALPLLSGSEVVLKTRQVDPFDPLRGQFLIIAYDAGQVNTLPGIAIGDTVYVALEQRGETWEATSVSAEKPSTTAIKGSVESIYGEQMTLRFGIEQYFFERGAEFNATNLTVRASIGSDGQARIVELMHNGKPLTITYRS